MYNYFKLDNGLRVVTEHIDYVKSVSVGLWVENGSRNENIKNNGISHFIEHMFFKGTKNRTAKEIAETIEDVGGQINAFTGKEATCFYIKTLDTHLELSLDVLSDMLFNSKFDEEEIEKEKGVIIEEINMNEDSPEDVLSDLHSIAIWGEDPISYPILGSIENVKSFNQKILKDYIEQYYIPENSVISICGNFDVNSIEYMVDKFFGNWSSSRKKITTYSTPTILNNSMFKQKSIEQLHISLGLQGIPLGDDDIYTLLFLNNILGGGVSSILFQKVREELGLCYSIYSYISSFNNTGTLNIYTGLTPSCAGDALNIIKENIYNFSKSDLSKDRIFKTKEQLKAGYIIGLESTNSRMFSNGKSVLFLNRINTPEDIMEKIDNINIDSIKKIQNMCFKKGILNSAFVGNNVCMEDLEKIMGKEIIAFHNKESIQV